MISEKSLRYDGHFFTVLQKFFNTINLPNNQLIQIKIQLLNELVDNKIIKTELEIIPKKGKNKHILIKNLTISNISRRIKYLKLTENFNNQKIRDL